MVTKDRGFVEQVREGDVFHPTRIGFDAQAWTAAFERTRDPTPADEQLHRAGLWLGERVGHIYTEFQALSVSGMSEAGLRRLCTGVVNHTAQHWFEQLLQVVDASAIPFDNDAAGPTVAVSHRMALELGAYLAAARHVLCSARFLARPGTAPDEPGPVTRVRSMVDLMCIYDSLRIIWQDFVWESWVLEENEEAFILRCSDLAREHARAIGEFRRQAMLESESWSLDRQWRALEPEVRAGWSSYPRICGLKADGHRLSLEVNVAADDGDRLPTERLLTRLAHEGYYAGVFQEPLPQLAGVSVLTLLRVWEFLSPLGRLVNERFPHPAGEPETEEEYEIFAPVLRFDELHAALSTHLRLTAAQAKAVVKVLTFTDRITDDLWLRPLVCLSADEYTVMVPALVMPNVLRSAEYWMRQGGLDLSLRGPALEKHIRGEIGRVCQLPGVVIVPHSIPIRTSELETDIDLVIRFGDTVLLGEVKCDFTPDGSSDYHWLGGTIADATWKLERKVEHVRANFDWFVERSGLRGLRLENVKIVPVIVSNLLVSAAYPNRIPVVDVRILRQFFAQGWHTRMAIQERDGSVRRAQRHFYYTTTAQAEAVLESYLRNPPHVATATALLKEDFELIPQLDATARPALYQTFIVELPGAPEDVENCVEE